MTKFLNKFKKPYFWSIFPIFVAKIFFSKNPAVTHNSTWASNTMLSFRKKLRVNPKKNSGKEDGRTDGQTLIYRTLPARAAGSITFCKLQSC